MLGEIAKRYISSKHPRGNDLDRIRNIVLNSTKPKASNADQPTSCRKIPSTKVDLVKTGQGGRRYLRPVIPEWIHLNETYNQHYRMATNAEINNINHFFNTAEIKFEWSVSDFKSIPSEIVKSKFNDMENPSHSLRTKSRKETNLGPRGKSQRLYPGRTSVPFELINGLPEIAFLGRSNAGKSTILNNLLTRLSETKLCAAAKVSSKPGFTRTLNCFNIGNKFRLVDTPGYGYGSTHSQGDLTMEYLQGRDELKRCFILVSANDGFTELDLEIMGFLRDIGRPFEVVFTKMDKVKNLEELKTGISESGILEYATLPKLIFTNSRTTRSCPRRYGMDLLRYTIFESCGLLRI